MSNVPDRLLATARNMLTLSERTKLNDDEVKLLLKMLEKHYHKRINREIEHQAQNFQAQNFMEEGHNMHKPANILNLRNPE